MFIILLSITLSITLAVTILHHLTFDKVKSQTKKNFVQRSLQKSLILPSREAMMKY
jgi:hypothetical protein